MIQRRRIFISSALIIVALIFATVFVITKHKQNASAPRQLRLLPELVFKNYEGQEINITSFRGHALIINAWASWCPFCDSEFADFIKLKKEFGDRIVIVIINRGESLEAAKKYTDKIGITNDMVLVIDPTDSFYQAIGGFSMPETVFVDASGFIRDHKRGPMDLLEMQRRVQDAFNL